MELFIEAGKKKVFVGALEWPGWCRFGSDEQTALDALLSYGGRYAKVLENTRVGFQAPASKTDLNIVERHQGNASTDFGAPSAVLDADQALMDPAGFLRAKEILRACWEAFDSAIDTAFGHELRKGSRGGGRDLEKIIVHVVEADRQYLRRLAGTYKPNKDSSAQAELPRIRAAVYDALDAAERGELPTQGPRGGVIWPPRYFVRRVAWHVLDHAWEVKDRVVQS